ncbi:MAG: ribokinase [Bacteroidales bacterium]|nr:ribokinase [Bacteroidales bacterium]
MSILVIGSSNTDLVVRSEKMPKPGETLLGGTFFVNPGGKGANQAVAAARLGERITFCCMTGCDDYGRAAKQLFDREGIDTSYVFSTPDCASGVALIIVDAKGENSIVVASGANLKLLPEDIDRIECYENFDIVLCQLETPVETVCHAARRVKRNGGRFVLNPAPACALPDDLLSMVDIITPNETEAEFLSGVKISDCDSAVKAAEVLAGKGIGTVIITLGSKGALLYQDGRSEVIPAFKVKAVDTTAAGDVFNGALCVALSEGKDMRQAIRFAQAASSIAVTRPGAQQSAPSREDVEKVLNKSNE